MGAWGLRVVTMGLLVAGCAAPAAEGDGPRSPGQIGTKYRAELEENSRLTSAAIVWPICDDPRTPRRATCGLLATWDRYAAFVHATCKGEDPDQDVSERCTALWNDAFETLIRRRYPKATDPDIEARCGKVDCTELEIYELAVLGSHNAAVGALGTKNADRIIAEHDRAQERARRARAEQAEDAETRRRVLGAVAAGLQTFGQSMQQANVQANTYTPQAPAMRRQGCSSDFECGMGKACVKPAYQSTGTCVRTVDGSGSPTFQSPRNDSIGPASGGCMSGGTCPMGWRCEYSGRFAGQCVK